MGVVGEGEETERLEWSWMGNRSPLMGGKGEAEWVLERLMRRLETELEELRREEAGERGEKGREMPGEGSARRSDKVAVKDSSDSSS